VCGNTWRLSASLATSALQAWCGVSVCGTQGKPFHLSRNSIVDGAKVTEKFGGSGEPNGLPHLHALFGW